MPWKDQNVYTAGTIGHHCTHVPYPNAASAKTGAFDKSPFFKSLNGQWKFSWAETMEGRIKGFEQPDFDDSSWKEIPVPSCVEMLGYGKPYHQSLPGVEVKAGKMVASDIPDEVNPVASYRKLFTVPAEWDVRSAEPNTLVIRLDDAGAEVSLVGGEVWQEVVLQPADFNYSDGRVRSDWLDIRELKLSHTDTLRSKGSNKVLKLGRNWKGKGPEIRNLRWEGGSFVERSKPYVEEAYSQPDESK